MSSVVKFQGPRSDRPKDAMANHCLDGIRGQSGFEAGQAVEGTMILPEPRKTWNNLKKILGAFITHG